jgi:hypothetical protein
MSKPSKTNKRKGARTINVDGTDYYYYRGSSYVEIVNSETGTKKLVDAVELETSEFRYPDDECSVNVMTPSSVASYIRNNMCV